MPTMLKAEYAERGPVPEDLIRPVEDDVGGPGPGQVLLEVVAAPINPADVLTLTGEYGQLPDLPAVGGGEGVGRVAELGAGVEDLSMGRLVILPPGSGTWRTHMLAPADRLISLPDDADPLQMSMVTVNPPTASLLLSEFGSLSEGDWVIQNAANSGVGTYVVQLARERGIRTANVVRRESAVAGVLEAGGDICLVDGPRLRARIESATGGARPVVGYDAVGGTATGRLASTLENGGVLVNYGAMSGDPCSIPSVSLVFNGIEVRGFWLVAWYRQASRDDRIRLVADVSARVADGRLTTAIAATYPVERVSEAVRHAASGDRDGKVLIVPSHE